MKIKSIYIDGLHNASKKTYDFGDINYIFGNNGIGKSTILQAIQFALLGYIPGTAKNSKEALLRHSPKGRIEVTISLTDTENDSDITVNRIVTAKTTEVNTIPGNVYISDIIQDIELPIFNFNDFVGQTANKLKEYFIKNILPTSNGQLDWNKILTDSILDCNFQDREEIIKYGMSLVEGLDGEVLDQVISANTKFKEEQSFNKTELQRLQNTIDSLIYYDDYVGPTDIASLNSDLLSLNAIRDQLIKYESAAKATQAAKDEYDALRNNLAAAGGREAYEKYISTLETLKQRESEISSEIAKKADKLSAMRAIDDSSASIINSKGVCPYTKDSCKSIMNKIEELRNESVSRKAEILEETGELENLRIDLETNRTTIRQYESAIQNITTIWDRLKTLNKTLGTVPEKPNTDKSVSDLDAEIQQINDNIKKLSANIEYNKTIEMITKLKYEAELKGIALAKWVKATDTNGLQTTLMVKPFDDLAATMTNYIVSMYGDDSLKAHFNISTKANSFSFGLIRNGIYIPYDLLSSGEKCIYSLSLMLCIINRNKSPLKVMLCDDMFDHLDNQAIESTFEALKLYNVIAERDGRPKIQFIFAGVKECNNAKEYILTV